MKNSNVNENLLLGYDYDEWYELGNKKPIISDVSTKTNSHILLAGMSGSGKSFAESLIMARLAKRSGIMFFADFKQDDSFEFLRGCKRYYPYEKTLEAIEIVYDIMHRRQSGEDLSRVQVNLVIDEYIAYILSLQGTDKKKADNVMRKISEIMMLGRSLGIRLVISCQRPDASAFPSGSRLNYGVIIILGAAIRSIYEMLIPKEYTDLIGDRKFKTGEGIVLLQGSEMHFIKIPTVWDIEKMKQTCIAALTRDIPSTPGGGEAASPEAVG